MNNKHSGSVLIIALWTLGLLSVFAAYIGVGVRQKITLASRIENRMQLSLLSQAGIKKAISVLNNSLDCVDCRFLATTKKIRHNNPYQFSGLRLRNGTCEVSYMYYKGIAAEATKRFGIVDEQSKININQADLDVLTSLIINVLAWDETSSRNLATAIYDWREFDKSELEGFYSQSYYDSLQYPYPVKNDYFELIDELLLVKGVTQEIFEKLKPFVTVYGTGAVNINTASPFAFRAIGIPDELIDKILYVRRGQDGIDFTEDDFIFRNENSIYDDIGEFVELERKEKYLIYDLYKSKKLGVDSDVFSMHSYAKMPNSNSVLKGECVFNIRDKKLEYYKEVY